jgi:predicted acylesterase/phospholipase RssA
MAAADQPHDTLPPCDLVMKGGITSGVVYPSAVKRLSEKYVFRNIGGASAGAIAAVAAAACEFRRRRGEPDSFDALVTVNAKLTEPHFIERLFQPTPGARAAFEAGLALQAGRYARALGVLLRRSPPAVAIVLGALLVWIAFVAVTVVGLASGGVATIEIVALVLVALVSALALAVLLAAAAGLALVSIAGDLNSALMSNGLGVCSGNREAGYDHVALTEWLHKTIQYCAGLPDTEPLTFGMLDGRQKGYEVPKGSEIALQFVTTDLSYSRPVDLPLPDPDPREDTRRTVYYFSETELRRLFPGEVVNAMTAGLDPVEFVRGGEMYYRMPGSRLPIVVAARLSLSFPILLSTVPLWSRSADDGRGTRHTMSDGGISSNFPIHFFDALLPTRPTFGLDLQPYPDVNEVGSRPPDVVFGPGPRPPVFTAVSSVFSFVRQILNAALDWRDTMQAELPGFRDRVCQIHLSKREGGLNLDMPQDVVQALEERGLEAGNKIVDEFEWDCHRFMRYLTFMQAMQEGLQPAKGAFETFATGSSRIPPACPPGYEFGDPPPWAEAKPSTCAFFAGVTWGEPGEPDFANDPPIPKGWARVTPRV